MLNLVFGLTAVLLLSCANKDTFVVQGTSDFFVQEYNPEHLDILWAVDNRSPSWNNKDNLVGEATRFFQRLDSATRNYRMGMVTGDMQFAKGQLVPTDNPTILTKNLGTLSQRVQTFSNLVSQVINLKTSASNKMFESVRVALSQNFVPRPEIPLVLVFVSDGDDSSLPTDKNQALDEMEQALIDLKDGDKNLVKIYSINLLKLPTVDTPKTSTNRCTTLANADIDKPGFQDRFFALTDLFGGQKADICSAFADLINLDGLRLREPETRFRLSKVPKTGTLRITITRRDGSEVSGLSYQFDASANEIVFDVPPPEGTSIQAYYHWN